MSDTFNQAVDAAVVLIQQARDACNHVVEVAEGEEEDSPLYDWAHNAYHNLLHELDSHWHAHKRQRPSESKHSPT